jgi:hypothetical protein
VDRSAARLIIVVAAAVLGAGTIWFLARGDSGGDAAGPTTIPADPAPTSVQAAGTTTATAPDTTTTTRPTTTSTTTTTPPVPTTERPTSGPDGFPDASTTGHLTQDLRPSDGFVVSEDGAVIEGLDISGQITIEADDVTIRDARITTDEFYGIFVDENAVNAVFEDITIIGEKLQCSAGLAPSGTWTARRIDVSGCADGVKMHGGQRLEHSYIHDLATGEETHNDAIQVTSGENSVIHHNTLIAPVQNAAIMMSSNFAPVDNWTITENRFSGGNYTVYIVNQGFGDPTRVTLTDNTWVTDSWQYGPYVVQGDGVTVAGNQGL